MLHLMVKDNGTLNKTCRKGNGLLECFIDHGTEQGARKSRIVRVANVTINLNKKVWMR